MYGQGVFLRSSQFKTAVRQNESKKTGSSKSGASRRSGDVEQEAGVKGFAETFLRRFRNVSFALCFLRSLLSVASLSVLPRPLELSFSNRSTGSRLSG